MVAHSACRGLAVYYEHLLSTRLMTVTQKAPPQRRDVGKQQVSAKDLALACGYISTTGYLSFKSLFKYSDLRSNSSPSHLKVFGPILLKAIVLDRGNNQGICVISAGQGWPQYIIDTNS